MEDNNKNLPAEEVDEEYEADILTLEDESGEEHTFEVIDALDVGEQRYLAMVPYSDDPAERLDQDAEMVIMRLADEAGEEVLHIVENNEELQRVGAEFLRRLEEVYDIDLDELSAE